MSLLRDFEQRKMDVEVATYLNISHVSNHEMFRKELAFFEGYSRWIPKKEKSTSTHVWISVF